MSARSADDYGPISVIPVISTVSKRVVSFGGESRDNKCDWIRLEVRMRRKHNSYIHKT